VPYALRLDMRRHLSAPAISAGSSAAPVPDGETRTWPPGRSLGDVILRAGRRRPVITSRGGRRCAAGVTEAVRGQDLFWSTASIGSCNKLLGLPPSAYRHHRLVLDDEGRKLSKSTLATGLRELRAAGAAPTDIRRLVGLP